MFLAADVMLVTPLRDGMNLVAKEYVACRHDLGGALVLSEFAGAWHELHEAFMCNPHDIEGLKQTIMTAIAAPKDEKRRWMKALRKRVATHDVQWWAASYLEALASAPEKPHRPTRAGDQERRVSERANTFNRRASDRASERIGSGQQAQLADVGKTPG
jgi:trehalose 6-phosphate synthase